MGLWQSLNKVLAGKPVFSDDNQERLIDQYKHEDTSTKRVFIDQHGRKIVPTISFRKFKAQINGSKVIVWAWVDNISDFEVELEKLELLGYHAHIGRRLRPHEGHEVMVYNGQVIRHDHDHTVRLYFTIHENDDLFLAEYTIEFNRESDGTFTLEEFHPEHQARDI